MKIVKLVSGGIDSYILSQEYDGLNVYVDFGQPYAAEEKTALSKMCVPFETLEITPKVNSGKGVFIPVRNLMFACIVATIFGADKIMMAGLRDDNCVDKTPQAFLEMSQVISKYANKPVEVVSPYFHMSKGEIIQRFIEQQPRKKNKLVDTFSCYTPVGGHECGDCPACLRKTVALKTNGIEPKTILSDRIVTEYTKKIHRYDSDRISRFFRYLQACGKKVYAIDLDGTLCEEGHYPYGEEKPKENEVTQIRELAKQKNIVVVIYTSRFETDRRTTERWLQKNRVPHDCLIMNKLPYDTMWDNLAKGV